jgi:hypothetical protein
MFNTPVFFNENILLENATVELKQKREVQHMSLSLHVPVHQNSQRAVLPHQSPSLIFLSRNAYSRQVRAWTRCPSREGTAQQQPRRDVRGYP